MSNVERLRAEVQDLRAQIEAVRAIHALNWDTFHCQECDVLAPCPTIRALPVVAGPLSPSASFHLNGGWS